jgi:hypothetical protein
MSRLIHATCVASAFVAAICPLTQLTHAQPVDLPPVLSVQGRNLADTRHIANASIAEAANAASPLFEPGSGRAVNGGPRFRM